MRLNELQDRHKEEVIFVVGAGPSVNNVNFDLLKDYTIMAVNSGIIATPYIKYMVSDDAAVAYWSYFSDLKKSDCMCLLYKNKWEHSTGGLPEERVVFYDHKNWFSPEGRIYNYDGLILTRDITKPIVGSRVSMGSCVHLAFCLGAKVIVLLGNDCQLSQDGKKYRYFWQYLPKEEQPYRIRGTKFSLRTQNFGFSQSDFVEYWTCFEQMNRDVLGKEVDIIDCSESVLDCFPKMNIEEVLKKYGEKND